ncbi:hypothetical protein HYW87_03640, partial [Candidatus Roizmanbacteria bacterium]|nr:hypothetical protein [Candidatus Roizmanbacteria bacterium]
KGEGFREALYYLEGDKIRKWLLPRPDPTRMGDGIGGIFLDTTASDNKTFYAIVRCDVYGGLCPTELGWKFYLYQLKFSSDPNVPLEAYRMSKLTASGTTNGLYYLHIKIKNHPNNPSKKIVYGDSGNLSTSQYVFTISDFNPSYTTMNIARQPISEMGSYRDYVIENDDNGDILWLSGRGNVFRATGIGLSENPTIESMTPEEQYKLLANPYTESITIDSNNNIIIGHIPLTGQFNNASVTIFEHIQLSPTTTSSPSPTHTPTPTPTRIPTPTPFPTKTPTPTLTPFPTRTPTPSPIPTPGVYNGGFEIDQDLNGKPDGWKEKNLTTLDRVVNDTRNGVKTKTMRFVSREVGKPTKILEQALNGTLKKGTTFTLSGFNRLTKDLQSGKIQLKVVATDTNGRKTAYPLVFGSKTHDWQKKSGSFKLEKDASILKVIIKYSGVGANAFFDDIRLRFPSESNNFSPSAMVEQDD